MVWLEDMCCRSCEGRPGGFYTQLRLVEDDCISESGGMLRGFQRCHMVGGGHNMNQIEKREITSASEWLATPARWRACQ